MAGCVWRMAEDGRLGVFAGKAFAKGEVVERCYCLSFKRSDVPGAQFRSWLYGQGLEDEDTLLFPFGWGLLYNELALGLDQPNLKWDAETGLDMQGQVRHYICLSTLCAVAVDEELCVLRRPGACGLIRDIVSISIKDLEVDPSVTLPNKPEYGDTDVDIAAGILRFPDPPHVVVRCSPVHGNGVYATKPFKKGDLVEVSPSLLVRGTELPWEFFDYCFQVKGFRDSSVLRLDLGFGSVCNHDDDPNLERRGCRTIGCVQAQKLCISYFATRDIEEGEELCHSYGQGWLKCRGLEPEQDTSNDQLQKESIGRRRGRKSRRNNNVQLNLAT